MPYNRITITHIEAPRGLCMADCCICKNAPGKLKIKDGNPNYRGKPICRECQGYRKLLKETR